MAGEGRTGPGGGFTPRPDGRRRITGAFSRLGSLTPGAGIDGARRSRRPAADQDAGPRPGDNADQWDGAGAVDAGWPARGSAAMPPRANPDRKRNTALVAGAGLLSVVAIAGVILAPRMLGPTDPGCKAYAGPALAAYNKTVGDLNTQATQSRLSADMSAAITQLTQAAAQAQGQAVKSALNGLLTQLKTVQADIAAGTVPSAAVNALNAGATAADHAC
jgi:hypothetical protein